MSTYCGSVYFLTVFSKMAIFLYRFDVDAFHVAAEADVDAR